MAMQIYNTLTKTKEPFEPVTPGKVGIYLCGPTVYKPSHIGHAVGPIVFDAIKRYLTHKGYKVTFVINITDVDDKLIAEASRLGVPMPELASQISQSYFESLAQLGVRSVDAFPRATECMGQIVALVERLIDRGAAYAVGGDVYFDHTASADYGKLSGRRPQQALAGTRELASKSRHSSDFTLWKAAKEGEPSWDSPWGAGRPGWHIECSAMSIELLGETFDIHGGGIDLVFPHHENEIAQSEAATGKPFAKYWMHNGLTRIDHKKMSKSEGNIRAISELLRQFSGETIRLFVLSSHYRSPLDFSDEQLDGARKSLGGFQRLFGRIKRITGEDVYTDGDTLDRIRGGAEGQANEAFASEIMEFRVSLYEAMDDDFNTAGAIATLHEMAGAINRYVDAAGLEAAADEDDRAMLAAAGRSLVRNGRILGLFETPPAEPTIGGLEDDLIALLCDIRAAVRKERNYALGDRIRDDLASMGVILEDTAGGTIWRKQ